MNNTDKFNFVDEHRTFVNLSKWENVSITMRLYDQEKNDFLSFGDGMANVVYEISTRERVCGERQ